MRTHFLLLAVSLAAVTASAEESPTPDGAVVRMIVKAVEGDQITLKILQVDRTRDQGQFNRLVTDPLPYKLPASALRGANPPDLVADAIVVARIQSPEQGGEVLELKKPGSYEAKDARVVPDLLAKARVRVTEEMKDPHLFIAKVESINLGDFAGKWGYLQADGVTQIDPETIKDWTVRSAIAVGTVLDIDLGPKGPVEATVVSGGVQTSKLKGVALGVGAFVAVVVLIYAWIVLRKKLIEA